MKLVRYEERFVVVFLLAAAWKGGGGCCAEKGFVVLELGSLVVRL